MRLTKFHRSALLMVAATSGVLVQGCGGGDAAPSPASEPQAETKSQPLAIYAIASPHLPIVPRPLPIRPLAIDMATVKTEFEMPVDIPPPPKPSKVVTRINSDGSVTASVQAPLAGVPQLMWDPGQVLRVRMTGGSPIVRGKVRQYAEEWTQYANIRFQFVDDSSPAEIKISFDAGRGSWSTVGRNALSVPFNFSTMNFGWFDDSTPDHEVRRVVLHEFGHALGFVHEHQSPAGGIQWNPEAVYRYYRETQDPPWDQAKVDQNIFARYAVSSTNYSQYDVTSIMHYAIPAQLTLNGIGTPWNTELSATDKQYAQIWYPRPGAAVGQLRTGDDCDAIDFRVEYDVEAAENVRFILKPGANVTWWKGVGIPIGANGYETMQIANGSTADHLIAKTSLDSARPIRFGKAKFLGVHTWLGYTWDVLTALPGGSRVTLDWVRDTCS